jgi:hypothetical protein
MPRGYSRSITRLFELFSGVTDVHTWSTDRPAVLIGLRHARSPVFGMIVSVNYATPRCEFCRGTGKEKVGVRCRVCEGRGNLQIEGSMATSVQCTFCTGSGAEGDGNPCHLCKGLGNLTKEGFAYRIIPRDPALPTEPATPIGTTLISKETIAKLRNCTNPELDFSKLSRLCEEINTCYGNGCFYATMMLIRALLDHIPPIFGQTNFEGVANNQKSSNKSFKEAAQHLQNAARKFADSALHVQMRKRESIPTAQQVQFGPDLEFLLAEIIRVSPVH